MNLGDIETDIYDTLAFGTNPDSGVVRRIRRYINTSHRQLLVKKGMERLRRKILPVVSVANSPFMCLPQAATKLLVLANRANNRNLDSITLTDLRYRDPGLNFTGAIPDAYVLMNLSSPVQKDPSVASSLFVISDSVLDTAGLSVNVEGITSAGVSRRASTVLNGTTGVDVDTGCTDWVLVTKFFITGQAAGNVTLREGSGAGTQLSLIPKGQSYPRFTIVQLSGTPSSSQTYYADVVLHIYDMIHATDEPLIPEDFHPMLVTGALRREFLKRQNLAEMAAEERNWAGWLGELETYVREMGGVKTGGQRQGAPRRWNGTNNPWIPAG